MLKLTGFLCSSPYDLQNLNRFYNPLRPLNDQEQAQIFHTLCRISSIWAIVCSLLPLTLGSVKIASLLSTGHLFTLSVLPSIALVISGLVLIHLSFDLSDAGERAKQIAHEGGIEEENTPFAITYITQKASYPKICAFLIQQVKI